MPKVVARLVEIGNVIRNQATSGAVRGGTFVVD
jgi:hypothetical protein